MRKMIIPALAIAMLSSCGGGSGSQTSQEQNTEEQTATAEVSAPMEVTELTDNEVNEIYKQIPAKYKDSSKKISKLDKEGDRFYAAHKPRKNWEDDDYSENINLLPMSNGGWKVVFCSAHCWESCGSEYHSFTYKDGSLTEDSKLIFPMDHPDTFLYDEFLKYGYEESMKDIYDVASKGGYYDFNLISNDTLECYFGPNGHESELWNAFGSAKYVWNGENFKRIADNNTEDISISIIGDGNLGGLRLGDNLDKNIPSMKCKSDGDQYYTYSRNGENMFTVHTGDDGKLDEILVLTKRFNCNDIKIGDSISKVAKNVFAYMIPSEDGAYVSITNYNNDNWIGYNATGKDGKIESIRIYKNYWAEGTATENFYVQAMNLGEYSAFTTDPFNDYSWEIDEDYQNVIRDNRHSRYAEEYFEFVQLKKAYTRYGILVYSTSFQGEDAEATYSRGVDVYKNEWNGPAKVGKGITAESIAKEYNVKTYEVSFSITVDGYITASIEGTDTELHYEINDNGEIIQK